MVILFWADALPSGVMSPAWEFTGYFLVPVVAILCFLLNRRLREKGERKRRY